MTTSCLLPYLLGVECSESVKNQLLHAGVLGNHENTSFLEDEPRWVQETMFGHLSLFLADRGVKLLCANFRNQPRKSSNCCFLFFLNLRIWVRFSTCCITFWKNMNTLTRSMLRGCSGETQRATRKRTILQLIFLFSHSHGQLRDVQDPFCEHTYTCVCIPSHRHILTLVITIVPEAHSGEVRLEQGWLALIRIDEC